MLKAILVDDEKASLDRMEFLLNNAGGVSVVGKFGLVSEAIAQAAPLSPNLIFMDIEMPGINGLDAAGEIRSRCPGAEIIFVTAHDQYALDAFDQGAIGYLLKPVSTGRLLKVLERCIRLFDKDKTAASQPFHLKVLGSMELYDDNGRLIRWRTQKTKELFAYFCHAQGQPVPRYRLIDDLWPELTPNQAQKLFHTTLYYLRNMLKELRFPNMVSYGDGRYWLKMERVSTDLSQLEGVLYNRARLRASEELLAAYPGDYFETEYYGWAESRRNELRSAYIALLEELLEEFRDTAKESLMQRLIALDPYREKHYKRLALYHREAGDGAAACSVLQLMKTTFENSSI